MDTNNVERNLRSLRRLYSLLQSNANKDSTIPEPFLLDEDTQILLKSLLDSVTREILATQSKIIAAAQFGLSETISLLNLPDSSSTKTSIKDYNYKQNEEVSKSYVNTFGRTRTNKASQIKHIGSSLRANGTTFKRNEPDIDPIARIETALSALSFRSDRGESDDRTRCYKSRTIEDYSSGLPYEGFDTQRSSSSKISPSLRSVNEATKAVVRSREGPTLPPDDDQFVRVKSRAPLPPLPVKSVGFKKPSQSKRMTQKTMSIKPTLLDQETESWDEDESDKTQSRTSSDGEELVSTEQESEENSREIESRSSGSSWETQEESVSGEEKSINESNSSYTSESEEDDDTEVSASPSYKKRSNNDLAKQRKKAVMGRFMRLKNKFGQVFHLHQHHHHHHHPHEEEKGSNKPSAWNHLQRALHYKRKEKTVEKRMKSEFKGLTTQKHKGGHFHGLVEGLMRHRKRKSTKQKNKLPSHGMKKQWWQTYKRQGRVKFSKKLGKKPYLLKKDQ